MHRWGSAWGTAGGARRRRLQPAVATLLTFAAGAVVLSCGDDGTEVSGGDPPTTEEAAATSTTGTGGLPSCAEARHLVVFRVGGALTADEHDVDLLLDDPSYHVPTRRGATDLVAAYHDRGYEVLYAVAFTRDDHGGQEDTDVTTAWLADAGFPVDERARVVEIPQELVLADHLAATAAEGGASYAGYTTREADIGALVTAGVPRERIYTFGDAAGANGTVDVLTEGTIDDAVSEVSELDPVCDAGSDASRAERPSAP